MTAFSRLHPHMQHAIVHDLGWRDLRPVQELAAHAILDGCNTVVLAPTAGGKTEAALFPMLSDVLSGERRPVAALYVCPIRALLNNQEGRVRRYARMVGLDAFKWHGDVAGSRKGRFLQDPAHVLMTTPESLEVLLIGRSAETRALFADLGVIVVDEVHAFAGDDRGAHLVSILERLAHFTGRDIQRVGLSATVGNPEEIGRWLQGSSARPFRLVDPPRPPAGRDLRVELLEGLPEAATGISALARGRKSLVFVESRSQAEKVSQALAGRGVEVFVHHSSVSRTDRQRAEEQFASGQNTAIVCTSTMELGIDVGDLDQVIQIDAPGSVASFLQRMGRTGRRPGTRPNCTFVCLSAESLLQAVALLRLAERGWIEDVRPARRAVHVLAHQTMALALQEGGVSRHSVLPWLAAAAPFAGLDDAEVQALIGTMLERDILYESDGLLSLGARGEALYGKKNFFELYAVFASPPVLRVVRGREEVGYIQATFVQAHDPEDGPLCFRLGGQAWQVSAIDWAKGMVAVRAADRGRVPSWLGLPSYLPFPICQEMKRALREPGEERRWLSAPAAAELAALRESYEGLVDEGSAPIEDVADQVQWHTFAGGAVNRLLAGALNQRTGNHWIAGNLSLKCKDVSGAEARAAIAGLRQVEWTSIAAETVRGLTRGPVSKFQPCLPEPAELQLLTDRLLDAEGARSLVAHIP